ncbi:hypothetical protein R1flu_023080 [Riccia fluitans]|uniref:Uncharacterized protein n=1 Tax=Riccia fluitans TaxID=41844 RepID=A0ABD1XRQ5_9MARC
MCDTIAEAARLRPMSLSSDSIVVSDGKVDPSVEYTGGSIVIRVETDGSQLFFKWIMIGSAVIRYERARHDKNGVPQPKTLEDLAPEDGLKYGESEEYGGPVKLFTWKRKRTGRRPNVVDYTRVYFGRDGVPKKCEFVDKMEAQEFKQRCQEAARDQLAEQGMKRISDLQVDYQGTSTSNAKQCENYNRLPIIPAV